MSGIGGLQLTQDGPLQHHALRHLQSSEHKPAVAAMVVASTLAFVPVAMSQGATAGADSARAPGGAVVEAARSPATPAISPPKVTGYLQVRETYARDTKFTATLNRARIIVEGTLPGRFSYRLMPEFQSGGTARTAAGVALRDAYVRWSPSRFSLWMGQFKTPFSREYLNSITAIETADRAAVVDTLATKRDIGVMAEYTIPLGAAFIGVFNGEGQNASLNRDSTVLVVGRLVLTPFAPLSVAGSMAWFGEDSSRYEADANLEGLGFLLRAELVGQHVRGRDRDDLGWLVLGGYRVLPWVQLVARREDFLRPSLGVARRISATTAGVNLDLPGGRTRLLANFIARDTGFPRVRRHLGIVQIQVRF
jgi:hypothetical protein